MPVELPCNQKNEWKDFRAFFQSRATFSSPEIFAEDELAEEEEEEKHKITTKTTFCFGYFFGAKLRSTAADAAAHSAASLGNPCLLVAFLRFAKNTRIQNRGFREMEKERGILGAAAEVGSNACERLRAPRCRAVRSLR